MRGRKQVVAMYLRESYASHTKRDISNDLAAPGDILLW